jgi:hypothetical protein
MVLDPKTQGLCLLVEDSGVCLVHSNVGFTKANFCGSVLLLSLMVEDSLRCLVRTRIAKLVVFLGLPLIFALHRELLRVPKGHDVGLNALEFLRQILHVILHI